MSEPVECAILHVDMDAFYASVMIRDRPELNDVPVVVGGGHRGVVLSANYPARRFGIRSGMSGIEARRLCPDAITMPPDFSVLTPVSRAIMDTFRTITPVVEVTSLDEAFLDVRGAVRLFGPPEVIAERVRSRIRAEHGITCSVGIAATIAVAKLASRRAKPDGVRVIAPEYLGSQAWPFPYSLMVGFTARVDPNYAHLDLAPDGIEIEKLRWFSREDLAAEAGSLLLPGKLSIAGALIEHWYGGPVGS